VWWRSLWCTHRSYESIDKIILKTGPHWQKKTWYLKMYGFYWATLYIVVWRNDSSVYYSLLCRISFLWDTVYMTRHNAYKYKHIHQCVSQDCVQGGWTYTARQLCMKEWIQSRRTEPISYIRGEWIGVRSIRLETAIRSNFKFHELTADTQLPFASETLCTAFRFFRKLTAYL